MKRQKRNQRRKKKQPVGYSKANNQQPEESRCGHERGRPRRVSQTQLQMYFNGYRSSLVRALDNRIDSNKRRRRYYGMWMLSDGVPSAFCFSGLLHGRRVSQTFSLVLRGNSLARQLLNSFLGPVENWSG